MESKEAKEALQLALDAGILQLSNGAEIWRVESTLNHICAAYGVKDMDMIVLSNAIFITGNNEKEEVYAKVKHIPISSIHMGIVTAVNNLSREIAMGQYTVEEAAEKLEQIKKKEEIRTSYRTAASAMGAACFIYILGANVIESLVAGVLGGCAFLFYCMMEQLNVSKLVRNIFSSAFVGLLACLLIRLPILSGQDINKIVIGGIMPLIPGAAFVNSIRDIANNDFLSGTARILDTLMVFVYLAVGAVAMLTVCGQLMGGI